jgi:hypothetical protein
MMMRPTIISKQSVQIPPLVEDVPHLLEQLALPVPLALLPLAEQRLAE